MRTLSPDELRFQLRYALSRLPKSTLRDMQLERTKRDAALDAAAEAILAQLSRYEVRAPNPLPPPFATQR
jgi:predicted LPLAT superfamily acyltransferase